MPTRRRRQRTKKHRKKNILFPVVFLSGVAVAGYLLLAGGILRGMERVSVVTRGKEKVIVTSYDFVSDEIVSVVIPSQAEVEVARSLGSWRIGSVWELGENEKVDGLLLAETITRYYKLPVYVWADTKAMPFVTGDVAGLLGAVFGSYKTNLSFGDKVRLALFTMSVGNTKRTEIDLVERSFLIKQKLTDGGVGYIKNREFSTGLTSIFSDPEISKNNYRVVVTDATGGGVVASLGKVVEIVGLKISSIVDLPVEVSDCEVVSSDRDVARKLSLLFGCKIANRTIDGNFDVEIKIGSLFAKRY